MSKQASPDDALKQVVTEQTERLAIRLLLGTPVLRGIAFLLDNNSLAMDATMLLGDFAGAFLLIWLLSLEYRFRNRIAAVFMLALTLSVLAYDILGAPPVPADYASRAAYRAASGLLIVASAFEVAIALGCLLATNRLRAQQATAQGIAADTAPLERTTRPLIWFALFLTTTALFFVALISLLLESD